MLLSLPGNRLEPRVNPWPSARRVGTADQHAQAIPPNMQQSVLLLFLRDALLFCLLLVRIIALTLLCRMEAFEPVTPEELREAAADFTERL